MGTALMFEREVQDKLDELRVQGHTHAIVAYSERFHYGQLWEGVPVVFSTLLPRGTGQIVTLGDG